MAKTKTPIPQTAVNFPEVIRFTSDDSELKFIECKVVNGFTMAYYKYTKSLSKLGEVLPILDIHLKGALGSTFCKSINK